MKKSFLFCTFLVFYALSVKSQTEIYPYSFQLYQGISNKLYSTSTRFHTSIKPIFKADSAAYLGLDSVVNVNIDTVRRSWAHRKLFNEHLVQIAGDDYNINIDFLPDFQIGRDVTNNKTTWLNTRGFQIQGNVGSKFSFYTSAFENQAVFPQYLTQYINNNGIIPSQVNDKFGPSRDTKDWAYASAILNYTLNKHFSFTLGQDKNFIGDGYRSMLLSDVASNYPFLKVETTLGNVRYLNIWAQFQDLKAPKLSYENGNRKKWGVFHYLDWNVTNRLSLGFFDAIIWQGADETGRRGFDVTYLNPIIFLRTIEGANGSPDNALLGFNGKYKIFNKTSVYGQFSLDEFTAKEFFSGDGYWANKYGIQLGVRSADIFKMPGLNFLAEYNTARPYTYSQRTTLLSYGHYNEALAHPFGANFKEFLTIWNYSYRRWQIFAEAIFAQYGLDTGVENNGKDIYKSYNTRSANYGNFTGQGLKTDFTYLDGRISFLLNPKYNLRLEAGAVHRSEQNSLGSARTNWLTFGLRSSFRNLYQDF